MASNAGIFSGAARGGLGGGGTNGFVSLPDPRMAGGTIAPLSSGGTRLLIIIFPGGDPPAAFFAFHHVPLKHHPQFQ